VSQWHQAALVNPAGLQQMLRHCCCRTPARNGHLCRPLDPNMHDSKQVKYCTTNNNSCREKGIRLLSYEVDKKTSLATAPATGSFYRVAQKVRSLIECSYLWNVPIDLYDSFRSVEFNNLSLYFHQLWKIKRRHLANENHSDILIILIYNQHINKLINN